MLIYYVTLILILGLAYPLCIRKPSQEKKLVYLLATFAFLFFLSATRYEIGNDYFNYIETYKLLKVTPFSDIFSASSMEPGFLILFKLMAMTGMNNVTMYAFMAILCLAPVFWFIYRYSDNVWLSVWLYVTVTFFYETMNFIRQSLAVGILLLGYPLLRKKKVWAAAAYCGVILAAATFHKTALIMAVVLLVCHLPVNKWLYGGYAAVSLVLYFTSEYVLDWVMQFAYSAYQDTTYLNVGLKPLFLILPSLALILLLCCYGRMKDRYPDATLVINLTLYSFLVWLFITKHMILERFSLYIYIYILIAIPMAVECIKPDPALISERDRLRDEVKALKTRKSDNTKYKPLNAKLMELTDAIQTQRVLYWCLVAAVLIATLWYNIFGMTDGSPNSTGHSGFHGVFPYTSLFDWINRLP